MISIKEKQDCCGCTACIERCPKKCITMWEDEEGFLYPLVNVQECVTCGLCEKVCPVINQGETQSVLHTYATFNPDENIRKYSSSGGLFTLIAEYVIASAGVVFGACFDENWEVRHSYTETKEGLSAFRGSKYVQSRMENSYCQVEEFLRKDRLVLFSGTPCQVAGLKRFLRNEYENLLTVDFICHGVPSPKVWRMYLDEITAHKCGKKSLFSYFIHEKSTLVESISFRNKNFGWKKYSLALTLSMTKRTGAKKTVLLSEPLTQNMFLRGFMSDLFLRPSCHACKSREFRSSSDITIADCWGINMVYPNLDDDKGYSLCILKNDRYNDCLSKLILYPLNIEFVKRYNPSCFFSSAIPTKRANLFSDICSGKSVIKTINKYATYPDTTIKTRIVCLLKNIGIYSFAKKMLGRK